MLMVKKIALVLGFGVLGAAAAQAVVSNGASAPANPVADSSAPATTMVAPAPGGGDSEDKPCSRKCPSMQ